MSIARTDRSVIAQWWWTVDRWTLVAILMLCAIGTMLIFAASPGVALRILHHSQDPYYFVRRELPAIPLALGAMFVVSLLPPRDLPRLAALGLAGMIAGLALTLVIGHEIKGARRWIDIAGISLQPSEFVKPFFAIAAAWLFSRPTLPGTSVPGWAVATLVWAVIVGLLAKQPDVGQAIVVTAIWLAEFYLAGLPILLLPVFCGGFAALGVLAYWTLPYIHKRVDRFLEPNSTLPYQIEKAEDAFTNGGLWGRGAGEGVFKTSIPDAHTDFVLAVAGEELGLFFCLLIVGLFAFIVLRGFRKLATVPSPFVLFAGTGLLVQFGLQAVINMASSVHLMPPKGMTLPFLSYGLSSLVALGLGMGMLLALTRKRFGGEEVA